MQWYSYVPTASNVRLFEPDEKLSMLAGDPVLMNVTLCAVPALLVHVTVPPFVIVTDDGEKEYEEYP